MTTTIAMKPVIFSPPMVRAILDGRKTQTRRIVKPQPPQPFVGGVGPTWEWWPDREAFVPSGTLADFTAAMRAGIRCPLPVGTVCWVREKWKFYDWTEHGGPFIQYAADGAMKQRTVSEDWCDRAQNIWAELSVLSNYIIDRRASDQKWRSPIYMPRWVARLFIEVTAVKVERVQDINHRDALAEGVEYDLSKSDGAPVQRFAALWRTINGRDSWDANPWVWAYAFKRLPLHS